MNCRKDHSRLASMSARGLPAAILAIIVLAAVLAAPLPSWAKTKEADSEKIITLPWENASMKPVPPSFVLPKQNRWGCLACHANKKLSKFRGGREASLYVDPDIIGDSMHKKIACIDCHTNFSYEEHPAKSPKDFRKVAGLACMKCHPFQAYLYRNSIHGELALQNKKGKLNGKEAEPALCSSCHGFHDIQSPRFEPYKAKFRASAEEVCGRCHADRWESYRDYYHGMAYRNKAKDAPTCWDCHENHKVVKKDNSNSSILAENLPRTCGKCHDMPTANMASYGRLIHNRDQQLEKNPILKLIRIFIPKGETRPETLEEEVKRTEIVMEPKEEGFLLRIFNFFFPKSLRPAGE